MTGRSSRHKGARGEREIRDLLLDLGFVAKRDGRLNADISHNIPGLHIEVKRREKYDIQRWVEQAENDAPEGHEPVVAFRRNEQPWRVIVSADFFFGLLAEKRWQAFNDRSTE
jgi:Holliday junction resolvase